MSVLGGGIAGLTAAHELALRGFDVTVHEKRAWGGKARSTTVAGSGRDGRADLPGEHAYRAFFGCYQNTIDTMRRLNTFESLVEVDFGQFLRLKQSDVTLPLAPRTLTGQVTPEILLDSARGLLLDQALPPDAVERLVQCIGIYSSSCDERRNQEIESVTWSDFVQARSHGGSYQDIIGTLPQFTQASKSTTCNAKYMTWVLSVWILDGILGRGTNGPAFRVLDAPTNDAFIDPWLRTLRALGVHLDLGSEVTHLEVGDRRITGVGIRSRSGGPTVRPDYVVCALPVERARQLWSARIRQLDPSLAGSDHLGTAWMNGISLYLRRPLPFRGIYDVTQSPWALSGIPQGVFWTRPLSKHYGDGSVHDKFSIAIADWTRPGELVNKRADQCNEHELIREVWGQFLRNLNTPGRPPVLTDADLHSWQIDPGMLRQGDRFISDDPLILPTVGTERFRPDPATRLANLALAGDYLAGPWEVANMEAASFNGRRAANVILGRHGSLDRPLAIPPWQPPEWEPLRREDQRRFAAGQANLFDLPVRG